MANTLNLRIHNITCIDETGHTMAEKFGHDKIFLGGFTVDAWATVRKIATFSVKSDFDAGEVKKYDPPRTTASFPLRPLSDPGYFFVNFLLIENDESAFQVAADNLYERVVADIARQKTSGVAAGLRWPAAKRSVNDYFKEVVKTATDKLFMLQDVGLTIQSNNHTWNGKNTSPVLMAECKGHSGIYQIFYDWELL